MPEAAPVPHLDVLVATGPAAGAVAGSGPVAGAGERPAPAAGDRIAPDPAERELCALYAHPAPTDRPWLRANMVTTLDGSAWGATGRSASINSSADFRAFCAMRAMADVVLVGAGTVRAEGYTPLQVPADLAATRAAAGLAPTLVTAVVTRSGDLPESFLDSPGAAATLVLTTSAGAQVLHERVPTDRLIVTGDGGVDLAAALAALAGRGLSRVLCEGGPTLLGDLVAASLVDELCVTTSPMLVGGPAERIVHTQWYLDPVPTARLGHLLVSDGSLLARWVLAGDQQ